MYHTRITDRFETRSSTRERGVPVVASQDIDYYILKGRQLRSAAVHRLFKRLGRALRRALRGAWPLPRPDG